MPVRAVLLALGLALATAAASTPLPDPDPTRLRADLEYLCSPALTGRETGTTGADQAAAFLAERMRSTGLAPLRAEGLGGLTPYHFPWTYHGFLAARGWAAEASNVLGVLPGSDPGLRGEYVFITAHYDHLGNATGVLYPGADDNASGTAGLLELIRMLRAAAPRRSLAFMAVSGEEEGLLGSEAYLRAQPVPNAQIKAEINLDMIGRGRPGELHVLPAKHDGYVTTLTANARAIGEARGIPLSAGVEEHYRDSDHWSFALRGIPSICFNTGLHADYHRPTDTPDKIDYGKLGTTLAVAADLALTTANAQEPPEVIPERIWATWVWGPFTDGAWPRAVAF